MTTYTEPYGTFEIEIDLTDLDILSEDNNPLAQTYNQEYITMTNTYLDISDLSDTEEDLAIFKTQCLEYKRKRGDDETPIQFNKRPKITMDIADAFESYDSDIVKNAMENKIVRIKQEKKYGPKAGWVLRSGGYLKQKIRVTQDSELGIYDPQHIENFEKFPASLEVLSECKQHFMSFPMWFIHSEKQLHRKK